MISSMDLPEEVLRARSTASSTTLTHLIRRSCRLFCSRPAVVSQDKVWTYGELDERSNRLANALSAMGIGRGDPIAVLSENRVEYVEVYFAASKLGAMVIALNTRLHPNELAYCLSDAQVRLLFNSRTFVPAIEAFRKDSGVGTFVCFDAGPEGDYVDYGDLLSLASSTEPADLAQAGDCLSVVYTSGTTGRPKGAMLSQATSAARAYNIAGWLRLTGDDGFVGWPPLYHIGSYEHLFAVLLVGGQFAALPKADPELMYRMFSERRMTYTLLLPGVMTDFMRFPDRSRYDISSFRVAAGYANLLSSQIHTEFMETFSVPYHDIFGQTETSYVTVGPIDASRQRWENKVPMPYMDVRLLDDDLREVPLGQPGEFVVRGPNVCSGYLNNPEATAELFRGGWLHTGDILTQHEDGTFTFADRKKYLIKTGSENVYPAEVEQAIALHPAVQEVCVVGLADEKWGETVKAFVVLRPGASMSKEEVSEWCRARIASYKKPRYVEFLREEELPRSVTGKIMREPLGQRTTNQEQFVGK